MLGKILAIVASLVLLVGCSNMTKGEEFAAKNAVQVATIKFIDKDEDRADEVISFVEDLKESLKGEDSPGSVSALADRVRSKVEWDQYDQAESLVINNLIDAVKLEIQARVENKTLDPDTKVVVRKVLDWVKEAAVISGGSPDGSQATLSTDAHQVDREIGLQVS